MDRWFNSPWVLRLVSFVLAVLLWISVNLDNNMETDALLIDDASEETKVLNNIPLEVRFNEDDYTVTGVPQNVSVTVEGPNSVITPLARTKNFNVFVDLTDYGPGTHTVNVQHSGISNRLSVNIEPETVDVTVEERVSENFSVDADLINENQIGEEYELGEPEIEPSEVTITGAQSLVDSVAVVKAMVNVGQSTESIENTEAPVKVYDSEGNELNVIVEPSGVELSVPISRPSKELPLNVTAQGQPSDGLTVSSLTPQVENVTVYGPSDVLDQLNALPDIPVDVSEITEDATVEVDVPVPDGVVSVDPETIEVQVEVDESEETGGTAVSEQDNVAGASETVTGVPIEVTNLSAEQTVDFLEPDSNQIDVTLTGETTVIEEISRQDLRVLIDASGLEAGEHDVPISLNGPEGVQLSANYKNATIRIT
ncbi:YbbR-like domain-containing protein [Thalassobacillus sp. CUG 92003]|uniref:CdaR family protein n=1 Tax=Thalassobacillus sp. CUG 92003 TaxID=2736641 RepID=UPI0015E758D6|nr:CdaR family protein [Thalassobacillus sp. CUG 92003]